MTDGDASRTRSPGRCRSAWRTVALVAGLAFHAALGFVAWVVVGTGTYGDGGASAVGVDASDLAILVWLAGIPALVWVSDRWAWAALLLPAPWVVGTLLVASVGLG